MLFVSHSIDFEAQSRTAGILWALHFCTRGTIGSRYGAKPPDHDLGCSRDVRASRTPGVLPNSATYASSSGCHERTPLVSRSAIGSHYTAVAARFLGFALTHARNFDGGISMPSPRPR